MCMNLNIFDLYENGVLSFIEVRRIVFEEDFVRGNNGSTYNGI